MKFFCDSCSTKYSIADEKIRGKILKVRCKNCGHVITVREQRLPTEGNASDTGAKKPPKPPPPPSSPRFDPSDVEWHYALNGQTFGPFELEELRERYRSGDLGDETYVWTESFSNWKPVSEVEWFQEALSASQKKRPRQSTVGVSGALEAIKPEDVEKYQSEKKASNTQRQRAVKEDKKAAQQDRLHALRARLNSGSKEPAEASESGAEPASDDTPDEFDGGAETVVGSSANEVAAESSRPAPEPGPPDGGENSGLFAEFDRASEPAPVEPDETEQSGRIPFSPKAPELESESKKRRDKEKDRGDGVTGSLLIQIDEIQKEGRGGRVLLIAAAIVLVAGVTAIGLYVHSQNTEDAAEHVEKSAVDDDDDDGEVEVRTYSDDEQKKILTIGSQKVGESEPEGADDEAEAEAAADDDEATPEEEPTKVAKAESGDKKKGLQLRGGDLGTTSSDDAFAGATKSGSGDDGVKKDLDEGSSLGAKLDSPIGEGSSFESMGGIKSNRSDAIYKPTDSVKKESSSNGPRLTSQQIKAGFRNVRRSIGLCRERHARRVGPLEARKIYLTLEIRPTGRVKGYEIEPRHIENTEFDRCMTSHRGRWKFASFGGSSTQKVRAPIVLD